TMRSHHSRGAALRARVTLLVPLWRSPAKPDCHHAPPRVWDAYWPGTVTTCRGNAKLPSVCSKRKLSKNVTAPGSSSHEQLGFVDSRKPPTQRSTNSDPSPREHGLLPC